MKKIMLVLIASACCSALTNHAFAQDADKAIADAVIAMVKACPNVIPKTLVQLGL